MRSFLIILLVPLVAGALCDAAMADGGTVRVVKEVDGLRISVFTSPNPLRAGPIDVSVLVQDMATAEPVSDAHVFVRLLPQGRPSEVVSALASSAAATNKLMQAALVELPAAGLWDVEIDCTTNAGPQTVRFSMEAGPPLPQWFAVWPWFTWPIAAVLVFGIHRNLVARKHAGH